MVGMFFLLWSYICPRKEISHIGGCRMIHIQAKQHEKPPSYLTVRGSPIETIPKDSFIQNYGVDTFAPGASSDFHFHDCDVWWIIVDGIARVFGSDGEIQAGTADMVFTPMGESHRIEAITLIRLVWFEGPLRGKKRKGHLYHSETEAKR
jgi:mannose-6-phosphate isomerase-like protein (cupin superfamily)